MHRKNPPATLTDLRTAPCYIEVRHMYGSNWGSWERSGLNAERAGGHYAYPNRRAAERMLTNLRRDLAAVDERAHEWRIVDAEPGAIIDH
jgi:hypothetical protein